jgi:hypothetical protein
VVAGVVAGVVSGVVAGGVVAGGVVAGGAEDVELVAGGLEGLVEPSGFVYWLFPADPPASANAGTISASAPRTMSRAAR